MHDRLFRSFSVSKAFTLVELLVALVILAGISYGVWSFISFIGGNGSGKIEVGNEQKTGIKIEITRNAPSQITEKKQEWTPEAIAKDPKGYSQYVESKLNTDVENFTTVNRELQLRMNTLAKLITDKSKLIVDGEPIAEKFAQAITDGKFPATVVGKEYTESQLRTQLALTLAQLDGYKESLAAITKGFETAQEEIKKNFLAIDNTKTKIALLATERAVWESRATSAEGIKLIETVNAALEGNDVILKDNPVRSLDDIIKQAAKNDAMKTTASNSDVDKYIQEFKSKKESK
jgi:prepilin-type N-terminal cleavage/methylation domain-containing protein